MSLFHREDTVLQNKNPKQLSGDSSVGEWLDHPIGGVILRDMLKKSGQDEKVLRAVRHLSLNRLIKLSKGQFTQEMVDDMTVKANSGEIPTVTPSPTQTPTEKAINLPEWKEKVTEGRFEGKTVIITGAGSGIGRATASRVAREGGRVIAVDISQDRLNELLTELPDRNISVVVGDITDNESIKRIITSASGTINALANVAGIMDNMTPLHEMSDEVWEKVINVNLLGMMKLSRAVLPIMLAKNAGNIVNVGSEASLKASVAGAAYTTSKHAVVGLTKSIAFMYGTSGIRANVVAPGAVLTNIEAKFESKLGADRVSTILSTMPEPAEGAELAAAITFLLSDDSVNINGSVLPSDGGWSVQ
jgi:NAD(P)-dependent dehydrogenase (short-subunit alcohol dehydrogenase family)